MVVRCPGQDTGQGSHRNVSHELWSSRNGHLDGKAPGGLHNVLELEGEVENGDGGFRFQVAREVEGFCGVRALVLVRLIGLESKGNLETRRAWVLTFDPRGSGLS